MSDYNSERLYQDEPLFHSSKGPSDQIPKEYREMRSLTDGMNNLYTSNAKLFYLQARFMENFEDSYAYEGSFVCYYPTYASMTLHQMRGYFSWRTQLRQGNLIPTDLSYVYVYIYELLHGIGCSSPEEGLKQLLDFGEAYREIDPGVWRYLTLWIHDYIIYHQLDPKQIPESPGRSSQEQLDTLVHCENRPDDLLFSGICAFSSYHIEKSRLYKKYPSETIRGVCALFRKMNRYYMQNRKNSYTASLFGTRSSRPYLLFNRAVFFNYLGIDELEYPLSDSEIYRCRQGNWSCEKYHHTTTKNKRLGDLLKSLDQAFRAHFDLPLLKTEGLPSYARELIRETVLEVTTPEKPEITFRLDTLDEIRRASEDTCQRLLTTEEMSLETDTASFRHSTKSLSEDVEIFKEKSASEDEESPELSATEREYLSLLLTGRDTADFLRRNLLMESLLVDQLNEKFFDVFDDTILIYEGESPLCVEDYIEDLKGMLTL